MRLIEGWLKGWFRFEKRRSREAGKSRKAKRRSRTGKQRSKEAEKWRRREAKKDRSGEAEKQINIKAGGKQKSTETENK